jgi:hypothetical protein
MRRIFRTHRARAGTPRPRPHRLRHTYGTQLASAGMDLLVLWELMGHASPETTAGYVHLSVAMLAAEYAAARANGRVVNASAVAEVPGTDPHGGLLDDYGRFVEDLPCGGQAKHIRRRQARAFLARVGGDDTFGIQFAQRHFQPCAVPG